MFHFKQFNIQHEKSAFKVGTDGVLLGAWADAGGVQKILDIGAGCGLIALMLAQRNGEAIIHGVELYPPSWEEANLNKDNSLWSDRVTFFNARIQDFEAAEKYDLIVSNPPYFINSTKAGTADKSNAKHTATLTHQDLLAAVTRLLNTEGKFCVVLPAEEGKQFMALAQSCELFCNKLLKVKPKAGKPVERLLMEFSFRKKETKESEFVIQFEKRNDYTPEYIALTKEFYTIM